MFASSRLANHLISIKAAPFTLLGSCSGSLSLINPHVQGFRESAVSTRSSSPFAPREPTASLCPVIASSVLETLSSPLYPPISPTCTLSTPKPAVLEAKSCSSGLKAMGQGDKSIPIPAPGWMEQPLPHGAAWARPTTGNQDGVRPQPRHEGLSFHLERGGEPLSWHRGAKENPFLKETPNPRPQTQAETLISSFPSQPRS